MIISQFSTLPDHAIHIRKLVFMQEQGFEQEFDAIDDVATHLVAYVGNIPVATCRIWMDREGYHVGRIAVIREYRGRGLGKNLLEHTEAYVQSLGGSCLSLHAQCRAVDFYRNCGFVPYGEVDYDEGVEHVHMMIYLD